MSKMNVKLRVSYDKNKPNGVKRKKLDNTISKRLKWKPAISLEQGFETVYRDYLKKR